MKKLPKDFAKSFADKVPPWGPVGYITYKRTYARLDDRTGKTEEWHQHCARLVNGLLELGAPLKEEEAYRLYEILFFMKGSVSGRAHWQLGTQTVRDVGADSLQNCFSGETEFLTSEGVRQLDDAVGEVLLVKTRQGFKPAMVSEFGKQRLYKVTTSRGEYYATEDHEWVIGHDLKVKTIDLEGFNLPFFVGEAVLYQEHVVSVEATDRVEHVYCVNVPEHHEFTLANGTLTGNCWHVACRDIEAFCFTFDELMLGGGVGYNIQAEHVYELPSIKYKPRIEHVNTTDCDFIVPDNREGWVEVLRLMLKSFTKTGRSLRYTTQCVRPAGARIKGFGGVASGANALVTAINLIRKVLEGAHRRKLRPTECLDIMNIIGQCVVAGNVRRSAQIALGDTNDFEYLSAKNWGSGKVPSWRAMSNNSVITSSTLDLPEQFWSGYDGSGEPYGLVNLDACRKYGRLADGLDYRPDPEVLGVNPCAEITLCDREACNLAEIYLPNIQNLKEFKEVARLLYISCKTISRVPFSNPVSEEVSQRNHRIGIGVTGWMAAPQWRDADKLGAVYKHLERCDKHYSKQMGLNSSIKLTCTKPSGCRPVSELTTTDQGFLRLDEMIDTRAEGWDDVDGVSVKHETRSRSVVKSFNNGEAAVFEINLSYGMSLRSTKDHPWYVTHRNPEKGANIYKPHNEWVRTCDLQENDLIETQRFELSNNVDFVDIDQESLLLRSDSVRIEQPTTMSEDLAWLIGYWFGDGCLSEGRFRFRVVDEYVEHLEKARRILSQVFGVEANINPCNDRNAYELSVGCKALYHWWKLNVCSDKADGIPKCVRQSNNRQILAFTAGFVDSDGCVTDTHIILTQRDGETMRELQHILLACGVVLGRSHNTRGKNLQAEKSMYLCSVAYSSDSDSVQVIANHSVKAAGYKLPTAQRSGFKVGRVKSVEYVGVQPTYDIEVFKDHWYYNGSFRSHNTLSLLPNNCPSGVHAAFGRHLIRRIRFAANDPLIDVCIAHGYHVEPVQQLDGSTNHDTLVVEFPMSYGKDTICEEDITVFDQLEHQKFLQTNWADNSVSATHYFRPHELEGIKQWLADNYTDGVKSASFLLANDHGFAQAPLEKITEDQYNELVAKTKRIVSVDDSGGFDIEGVECAGGNCPVK